MKTPKYLSELAAIFHDAETPEEMLGSLRVWASTIVRSPEAREPLYIEVIQPLNYRQQWAVQQARQEGRLVTAEVARRFNISMESARLDLRDLVDMGRLWAISEKKGRYYLPVIPNGDNSIQIMPEGVSYGAPRGPNTPLPYSLKSEY